MSNSPIQINNNNEKINYIASYVLNKIYPNLKYNFSVIKVTSSQNNNIITYNMLIQIIPSYKNIKYISVNVSQTQNGSNNSNNIKINNISYYTDIPSNTNPNPLVLPVNTKNIRTIVKQNPLNFRSNYSVPNLVTSTDPNKHGIITDMNPADNPPLDVPLNLPVNTPLDTLGSNLLNISSNDLITNAINNAMNNISSSNNSSSDNIFQNNNSTNNTSQNNNF